MPCTSAAAARLLLSGVIVASLLTACAGGDSPTQPISSVSSATVPSALQLVAGDGQAGTMNMALPIAPSVRLVSAAGTPMAGVNVSFKPGAGSGLVVGGTARTDSNGVATVGAWTLGTATSQTLVATTAVLPGRTVTFRATATASAFSITVRFVGDGGTDRQRQAFTNAAARWAQVIVGDVGTTSLNAPAGECQDWLPAVKESVHNLLVFVRIASIDGAAKVVGRASPCYVNSETKLPVMGFFELDQDDLALMNDRGILDDVVLHEMGHILGIGTLWNYSRALLTGSGSDDPYFTGALARSAFLGVGGASYAGLPVPVENTGGSGTRDAHWRKSVLGNELMQGFAQPGGMPLSRVTVASLEDLGYAVNMAGADSYTLLGAALRADESAVPVTALGDDIARAPLYEVSRNGGRRLVRPEME